MNTLQTNADVAKASVIQGLDALAEARSELAGFSQELTELLESTIPEDIRAKQAEIREELAPKIERAQELATGLEASIKEQVVWVGETVSGGFLQAVFNKGRQSWDSKSLKAYAKNNPEILDFYKQGDPYVSIKNV